MIQQPRLRELRYCLLWKTIPATLADQLGITQSFSDHSGNDFHESPSSVVFALGKSERFVYPDTGTSEKARHSHTFP